MPNRIPLVPADVIPGEILREEFLKPFKMSQAELAHRMGVERGLVSAILHGKRAITAQTAIRLAQVLGTSARFWLGLQNDHELACSQKVMEAAKDGVKKYRNALRALAKQ